MSGFKQGALIISEKNTPVTPVNSGDISIVARSGSLYTYDGVSESPIGGGGGGTWTSSTRITLADGEEYFLTHPTVINEKIFVTIYKDTTTSGQTYNQIDFDLADSSQFIALSGAANFNGEMTISPSGYATEAMLDLTSASILGSGEYGVWIDGNSGTYKGRNAFDNTTLTWLGARSSAPQWIAVDVGAIKNITKIRIRKTNQTANYDVGKFKLQYSLNGLTGPWIDQIDRTGSTISYTGDWYEVTGVNKQARYWRLYITEGLNGIHADGYGCGEFEIYESAPIYTTNIWNIITTSDQNRLSLINVSSITSLTVDNNTQPSGTEIKFLVSFDGRLTWKKYVSGSWVTENISNISNGISLTDINTVLTNYSPSGADIALDLAFGMITTNAANSPTLNGISILYDEDTTYDIATVGAYTNTNVEFGLRRISPTQTKIKNKTGTTQSIHFNVLT